MCRSRMIGDLKTRVLRLLGCAALALCPLLLPAAVVPEGSVSWTSSNNVNRATTAPDGGAQTGFRLGVNYFASQNTWNMDLRAATERLMYSGQDLNDDKRHNLYLRSEVVLLPDRISWELLDDFGQVATDPFGALNPSVLQDTNLFSTGPNLFLPFGEGNRLEVEARYAKLGFSGTDQQDNDRYSATVALLRNLTPIRNAGFALSRQHVSFAQASPTLRNYNLDSAFVVFSSAPRRSVITMQAGYSKVDDGLDSQSGPAAMITIERRLTDLSNVSLFARTGYADAADNFRFGRTGADALDLVPQNVQAISTPFRQQLVNLDYSRRMSSTQLSVSPFYARERYRGNEAQSRRSFGMGLTASFALGPNMQARLSGNATDTHYDDGAQDSRDMSLGVGLTYQFTRAWTLNLDGDRFIRSDSSANFTENRIALSLRFRPEATRPQRQITLMRRVRGVGGAPTGGFRPEIPNDE